MISKAEALIIVGGVEKQNDKEIFFIFITLLQERQSQLDHLVPVFYSPKN